MSQNVMVEVVCDAAGCERCLRDAHWVALPLSSMMRARIRRQNWLAIKIGSRLFHFCPEHRERPEPSQDAALNSARKRERWQNG
jgi:hypothetical protein